MLILYQLLARLIRPFYVKVILKNRITQEKEDGLRVHEKLGTSSIQRPQGLLLWVHAASVGETLSVRKLVSELQERYPHFTILMTTGTRTSSEIVQQKFPDSVLHQYAPLDFQTYVKRFLNFWRPDIALWVESELWPNMLGEIHRRDIPLISINVRFSPKSLKRWRLIPDTFKQIMDNFNHVIVQTKTLEIELKAMGINHVSYFGNLKFATPPLSFDEKMLKTLKSSTKGRPLILAASTHNPEETIFTQAHQKLAKTWPNLLTILVPRHPERSSELQAACQQQGLATQLFSEGCKIQPGTQVFIVDRIGTLGLFYKLCPFAFIGGSLLQRGGHNPIEAAQLGCVPLHGPHIENFQEIYAYFDQYKAVLRIQDEQELLIRLKMLLENPETTKAYQVGGGKALEDQSNILERVVTCLEPHLQIIQGVAA